MTFRWIAATALIACVACKDDPAPQKDAAPTATAPEPEAKIKSVFTAEPSGSAPPPGQAPPPTGVFGPGEADKAHAKGAPASLEIVDQGSQPRVVLRPPVTLGDSQTLRLLVGMRQGAGAMPNVVYTLKLSAPEAGEGGGAPAANEGPRPLAVTVTDVSLADDQPGQIPEELKKLLAQVKGSRIDMRVLPNGAVEGGEIHYGKDLKEAGVKPLVDNIPDVLGYFFSPFPEKPVGQGAYWISHDRISVQSLDLVRYRVTKVEELKGDEALLSVQLRHYLAGGDISSLLGKAQPGIVAGGFESVGQAQIARKAGSLVPITGEMKTPFTLLITAENNPQAQPQPVQFELQARLMPSEKKEPTE